MLSIEVNKKLVWPIRIFFIVVSIFLVNVVIDIFALGYVIGASGTKYLNGDVNFYLKILYYSVGAFVMILLAVQTQPTKVGIK
jgi:hypothetical protein